MAGKSDSSASTDPWTILLGSPGDTSSLVVIRHEKYDSLSIDTYFHAYVPILVTDLLREMKSDHDTPGDSGCKALDSVFGYPDIAEDSTVTLSPYDIVDESVAIGGAAKDRKIGEADSTLGAMVLKPTAIECDHIVTGVKTLVSGFSSDIAGIAIKGAVAKIGFEAESSKKSNGATLDGLVVGCLVTAIVV